MFSINNNKNEAVHKPNNSNIRSRLDNNYYYVKDRLIIMNINKKY